MIIKELLDKNLTWSDRISERDPDFFQALSKQQSPDYLWIGCSDSRVPATQLVGLNPGELFVHRNVANLVIHTDLNCLSVLQYAVDVLEVKHIIVVGHYGCGGVQAALLNQKFGLIDNWLRHVHDIIEKHEALLMRLPDEEARLAKLCELNVIEQAFNVCQTTVIQSAWERGQRFEVHGLIYGLHDGLLRDLSVHIASQEEMRRVYRLAVAALS
ncbi:MAG: carbonate dehydratase [Acidobacteriota bacterium]